MATVTRQPFAPLDGARLQNLTSLKNRQNALPANPSGKRKASEAVESDDFENVDPTLFSKRSKGGVDNTAFFPVKDFAKPSSPFVLTKAVASTPSFPSTALHSPREILKPVRPSQRPRTTFFKSPASTKINTSLAAKSTTTTPLSAPAGRLPTRGAPGSKRIGILSRRRTGGPFGSSRVDPPSFNLGSAAPFSLDAALKGTIPSYSGRSSSASLLLGAGDGDAKASWFFDIHEDTPEQEMTNLLQHGTCTLDISSDEESELKARRERDEGRNKENLPPVDDVSQTSARGSRVSAAAVVNPDDMVFEKSRGPLAEMNAADYYAEGCDGSSVVIVPGDEEEGEETAIPAVEPVVAPAVEVEGDRHPALDAAEDFEFNPELKAEVEVSVDVLMGKESEGVQAAVLRPIEGTGDSFELWESGSQKDEGEDVAAAAALSCEVKEEVLVQAEGEVAVAVSV
ncbi:Thymidylate kinase [Coniochaeta hoffmannii]|uniref:Thymidylate kinase n=1 Tax=Coniochaeta hoffmannii TaxID=91930 RepID=A0AA38RRJ4_9PEZI|nr:Thymidylate kinase [Coniochaeta hoffmannii]